MLNNYRLFTYHEHDVRSTARRYVGKVSKCQIVPMFADQPSFWEQDALVRSSIIRKEELKIEKERQIFEERVQSTANRGGTKVQEAKRRVLPECLSDVIAVRNQLKKLLEDDSALEIKFKGLQERILEKSKQVENLRQVEAYLKFVKVLRNNDLKIKVAVEESDVDSLEDILLGILNMREEILGFSYCVNIVEAHGSQISFVKDIVVKNCSIKLREVLKKIGWPFTFPSSKQEKSSADELISAVKRLVYLLSRVDIFNILYDKVSDEHSLLVDTFLEPIRKSFIFHFSGSRESNRLDRPEWLLSFAMNCIRCNVPFVLKHVQSVVRQAVEDAGCQELIHVNDSYALDFKLNFIGGVIECINARLSARFAVLTSSLPIEDFFLIRKTVEVMVRFSQDISSEFKYDCVKDSRLPSIFSVLTDEILFEHWISAEKAHIQHQIDALLSMESPWVPFYESSPDSDTSQGLPSCSTVSLLSAVYQITELFPFIQCLKKRIRFVQEILIPIISSHKSELEEQLTRNLQKLSSEGSRVTVNNLEIWKTSLHMLNSCNYMQTKLSRWNEDALFMSMDDVCNVEGGILGTLLDDITQMIFRNLNIFADLLSEFFSNRTLGYEFLSYHLSSDEILSEAARSSLREAISQGSLELKTARNILHASFYQSIWQLYSKKLLSELYEVISHHPSREISLSISSGLHLIQDMDSLIDFLYNASPIPGISRPQLLKMAPRPLQELLRRVLDRIESRVLQHDPSPLLVSL